MTSKQPYAAMLAEDMPTGQVESYIEHPNWAMSQKVDGHRLMVCTGDKLLLLNRQGESFKHPITAKLHQDIGRLQGLYWFDGEYCNDRYFVFDLIASDVLKVVPEDTYRERREALEQLFAVWVPQGATLLPQAQGMTAKKLMLGALRAGNAEGAMFRWHDSAYEFGRRTHHLRKLKFWKDIDVILYNIGRENKRSASMAVYDGDQLVDVGSIKLTDNQLATVQAGQVITAKYLYATEGERKLYQPSILKIRDDKNPEECLISQLKVTSKKVLIDDGQS